MQQKKSVLADEVVWDQLAEVAQRNRRTLTGEARVALEVYVHLANTKPDLIREAMEDAAPTS